MFLTRAYSVDSRALLDRVISLVLVRNEREQWLTGATRNVGLVPRLLSLLDAGMTMQSLGVFLR